MELIELYLEKKQNNIKNTKGGIYIWNFETKLWVKHTEEEICKDFKILMIDPLMKSMIGDEDKDLNNDNLEKISKYNNYRSKKLYLDITKLPKDDDFFTSLDVIVDNIPAKNGKVYNMTSATIRDREPTDHFTHEKNIESSFYDNIEINENSIKHNGKLYLRQPDCIHEHDLNGSGYIYIIRTGHSKKYIPIRGELFKIGITVDIYKRMLFYDTKFPYCELLSCSFCDYKLGEIEKEVMRYLQESDEFYHEKEFGKEYFSGDIHRANKAINDIIRQMGALYDTDKAISEGKWFGTNIEDDSVNNWLGNKMIYKSNK